MKNKPQEPIDGSLPYKLGEISAGLQAAQEILKRNETKIDALTTRLSEAEVKLRSLNKWKWGLVIVLILTILVFIFNIPIKDAVQKVGEYRGI